LKKMKNNEILHKVVTFLGREELDFLDNITKDILFSKGVKIPRSALLKNIIDVVLSNESANEEIHNKLISEVIKNIKKGGKDG